MSTLLFEIGTEEIPAGYLQPALADLKADFMKKIQGLNLGFSDVVTLGTPRRMVLSVSELDVKQIDIKEELIGPSKKAGMDGDGNYTKAAMGFARSKGVDVNDLKVVETAKGEYLMLTREVAGKMTSELLPGLLESLITDLSFPKSMIWGKNTKSFVRPIQWLLAILDEDVLPVKYNDLVSGTMTRGHRFTGNTSISIDSADIVTYKDILKKHDVIVDFDERREAVIKEVNSAITQCSNMAKGKVSIDEMLIDTVTNLVELPFGVCGVFDEKFLQLPPEVLITSMREHQKYFPIIDKNNDLLPGFIAVNNTRVKNTDITRKGHQRVLRARLEDALFFFESDKDITLAERAKNLDGIIFQAKLGTMGEKVQRIVKLTAILAEKLEAETVETALRTAELCKSDLLTDMVGEFPSLQGVMGGAYALHDGENDEVAKAVAEHYKPLRAGSEISQSKAARIVALADRVDTITGCFGINQIPTGTADPFGLRRLTLAILQILRESNYVLPLREIVMKSLALYGEKVDGSSETVDKICHFIKARYINDLVAQGVDAQAVDAVTSVQFDDIVDVRKRIDAFLDIKGDDAFPILAASFKRIRNIIKDNAETTVDSSLFEVDAEKKLALAVEEVSGKMEVFLKDTLYSSALQEMLALKQPVDDFFDSVMVMADDPGVRQNRLNLLTVIGELVLRIGDIGKMQ